MPKKQKALAGNKGLKDSAQGSILERLFQSNTGDVLPSISLYPSGLAVNKPLAPTKPSNKRGVRGDITGWSAASRRRLREWLLCHKPSKNQEAIGITLTIPGPPVSITLAKKCFDDFSKHYCAHNQIGMVWRLEIQKRGSYHWHALASVPCASKRESAPKHRFAPLALAWLACLDKLGPCDHITDTCTQLNCLRSDLFGALQHAVDIQMDGDNGAWLRYLQDHASKCKQEQIPENVGRQWGVVGRRFFDASECEQFLRFPDDASFYRFLRAFQRLCTPVLNHRVARDRASGKFASRPFGGKSLGWRVRRGGRGRSVWFSRPETVKALFLWAISESSKATQEQPQPRNPSQRPRRTQTSRGGGLYSRGKSLAPLMVAGE